MLIECSASRTDLDQISNREILDILSGVYTVEGGRRD